MYRTRIYIAADWSGDYDAGWNSYINGIIVSIGVYLLQMLMI